MKRNLKYLIIMLAVLAVLGGGTALLLLTQPAAEEEVGSSSSSEVRESLVSREEGDIASIHVENQEGGFTLLPKAAGEASSAASDSPGESSAAPAVTFQVEGLERYSLNDTGISSVVSAVTSISATKDLGALDSLAEYGLEGSGRATVTITAVDGSTDVFVLGSGAGSGSGLYLLKDGVGYVVPSMTELVFSGAPAFLATEIYSVPDNASISTEESSAAQTASPDILYSVSLSGTNFPKPIAISYDAARSSAYLVTAPFKAESGTDSFNTMLAGLKSLSATKAVAVGVTEEKLADYGLDNPFAAVTFDMNGAKHSLAVSEKDAEGNRYLTADGTDVVYQVTADAVSSWAEATLMDLRMSYIWLPNINNVEKLTLTANGTESALSTTRTVDEEKSTETSTSYTIAPKFGDKALEYTNYQIFYQKLISIPVLNCDEVTYGSTPVYSVSYGYYDSDQTDTITFYPIEGQDRYAVELNGTYSGVVRKDSPDKVFALIPPLTAGETLTK